MIFALAIKTVSISRGRVVVTTRSVSRVSPEHSAPHSNVRPLDVIDPVERTDPPQFLNRLRYENVSSENDESKSYDENCFHMYRGAEDGHQSRNDLILKILLSDEIFYNSIVVQN